MLVLFLILIALMGISMILGYYFYYKAFYPVTRTHEDAIDREVSLGNFKWADFQALEKEKISIPTPRGYDLFGYWIPAKVKTKKTIVFVHGITYNVFGSVKYMMPFIKWGYNVLIYDHRNHGLSGGDYTTFGYLEKYDLTCVIDWVYEKCGEDAYVATHGESMGAATVLQHAGVDPRVKFVIADCPYESAWKEFVYRLKVEYKLPPFPIVYWASLFSYFKTGIFFSEMSPMKYIKMIHVPVLWIHGKDDLYIRPQDSENLYEEKVGAKSIYLAEGAVHAFSYHANPEKYEQVVRGFLEENHL